MAVYGQDGWSPKTAFVDPDRLPRPYASRSVDKGPVVTWPKDASHLHAPPGFTVRSFANGLKSPRWLLALPNGDVLVTECYQGRIVLMRDTDNGGKADVKLTFLKGLDLPFGMALQDGFLYVAETDKVVRFPFRVGDDKPTGPGETIVTGIPSRGYRQHWTRNILFEPDGRHFLLTVGSETDKSPEKPPRATVMRFSTDGKERQVWATGIRNPVGLAYRPESDEVWMSAVERDFMGDDLVPEFVTRLQKDDFYGWPWYFSGFHRDPRVPLPKAKLPVPRRPDVLLTAHSVPLGIAFYDGTQFPEEYRGDLFVAMRGSRNRKVMSGYEVVRIRFKDGRAERRYETFVDGWCPDRSRRNVWGRPVGLAVWKDGSLLIADEGAGRVWRVGYQEP